MPVLILHILTKRGSAAALSLDLTQLLRQVLISVKIYLMSVLIVCLSIMCVTALINFEHVQLINMCPLSRT